VSQWHDVTLSDISRVVTGTTPSAKNKSWFGNEYEFITPTDIDASTRRATPTRWLSSEGAARLASRMLPPGATCFVCIGATIGKLCMTRAPSFTNQQINAVVAAGDNDPRFLYYLLRNDAERIAATASGAATPIINKSSFAGTKVRIPGAETQIRVGAVLGAIDDLIENNRLRIALLEQIGQANYREWFVHFRYPGHKDVELVDSPLGPIPHGWQTTTVGQSFTVVLGGTPSRQNPDFWNGEIPWLNSGKTNELRVIEPSEYITDLGLASSNTKLMPPKTTLIAITGATLGQVSILEAEMCANQSVVGIYDTIDSNGEWTYRTFVDRIDGIVQSASGGAQQHINKGIINEVVITRPTDRILADFSRLATPLGNEIATLLRSNRCLEAIRDLLLPKLVTGALDVSKLDLDGLLEEPAA